ncbi:AAA family ATPase [Novosphingobium sediminicola]|nr:ATP-binding protein [Novosphingobium sediminicola]
MIRICFHGAESTGKSVLAERLRQRFGWPWVAEYGREYAETHGTDFTMDDLLAMARGQNEAMLRAGEAQPPVLILDTDPLMTAAWAQMLFGRAPQELFAYPKADLYLLFSPDVPWVADGTRFFGTDEARARFAAVAEEMLVRAGVAYTRIDGDWEEREAQVVEAVKDKMPPAG